MKARVCTVSEFKYPDENDKLTAELIQNEFDDVYWGESEERILRIAEEFLLKNCGKETLGNTDLLDLGCGTGRLIPRFAHLFRKVVGIEPDPGRCAEAAALVRDMAVPNAEVLNTDSAGYLREHPDAHFGVVLCSHVFQHISHDITIGILRDLEKCTDESTVFIFTTTFISDDANEYSTEFFLDGRRVSEITDYNGFIDAMGKPGTLPVCRFSRK